MVKVELELITDLDKCKQWGYDEPVLSISDEFSGHVLQSSRVCTHEIKRIMKEIKQYRENMRD